MAQPATIRFPPIGSLLVSMGQAHLLPGFGGHKVTLPIHVASTWLNPDDHRSTISALFSGSAMTDQPSYRWLGVLASRVVSLRGYPVAEELVINLGDDQLVALERARNHGDVTLRLDLQVTLLAPPPSVHPLATEQTVYRISAEHWLTLLDQAGSEVGVVLRVPSPLTDSWFDPRPQAGSPTVDSLTQATARLRQARAELRDGQFEHCVTTCRRVLENVALLMNLPEARSVFSQKSERRNQSDRRAAIFYDVKSMASAAHHDDETTNGFAWSRADAEAILAMTAALLLWRD